MTQLSPLYKNLKKSYLWPTGSNFDKPKVPGRRDVMGPLTYLRPGIRHLMGPRT